MHLGSPHCKVDVLLRFLSVSQFEKIYIVGDLWDDPRIRLPEAHRKVLKYFFRAMFEGTKVVFIPGNHDKKFRKLLGDYGNLLVMENSIHIADDGRTMFLTHGDEFDFMPSGSFLHCIDRRLPTPFWEMLRKFARGFMLKHIKAMERRALKAHPGYDFVICGHTHMPVMSDRYINLGDWIKHCTALIEHQNGELELRSLLGSSV